MDLKQTLLLFTLFTTIIAFPQYDDYYDEETTAELCSTFAPGKFNESELQYK